MALESEITKLIFDQGIAIAMLVYFIFRYEKILISLRKSVEGNTEIMNQLLNNFERGFKK